MCIRDRNMLIPETARSAGMGAGGTALATGMVSMDTVSYTHLFPAH